MNDPIFSKIQFWTAALLFSFAVVSAKADDQYFEYTRLDPSVPSNCLNFELTDFTELKTIVVVGPSGARRAQFTHEYPITRTSANTLWMALQNNGVGAREIIDDIRQNPDLLRDYDLLLELGPQMGFDFGKEGDILEALALNMLKTEFPESHYFLTGGVAYRSNKTTPALGELDIIVGRKADCKVIAIGEVKLGLNQANHARNQLSRFLDFLKYRLCRTSAKPTVCNTR